MTQVALPGQLEPCLACDSKGFTSAPAKTWRPFDDDSMSSYDRTIVVKLAQIHQDATRWKRGSRFLHGTSAGDE